jgi:aryl-alcohol dehydrogenase-like predicted oxidoreductase
MRITPIPNTDLAPSALCLGTGDFGGAVDRALALSMLDTFLENGGNFIDTAKVYNDWTPGEASRSEKLIGDWLKQSSKRSRVIVATKGAHPDLAAMHIPRLSPAEIISDLDASLRHLRIDTIDIYYLHRDHAGIPGAAPETRPVEEIIDTLAAQVRAGKIRYFACSNWRMERIRAAQEYAQCKGLPGFIAVQNMWSLAEPDRQAIGDPTLVVMDDALWQYQRRSNLAAIPFSSQANGVFQKLDGGGPGALSPHLKAMFINPATLRRYANLQKLRERTGLTTTQIVLGYLMSQPFPTIPVIGPHNPAQLADTLTAGNVRLTPEQAAELLA